MTGSTSETRSDSAWPRLPKATGSSSSASGLPRASSRMRRRTRPPSSGNFWSSRVRAGASASGATGSRGRSTSSKRPASPARAAPRKPMGLPASRRATKASTRALALSSHGRSSTTSSTGWCSAAVRSSARVAVETRVGSPAWVLPSWTAAPRASQSAGSSCGIRPRNGPSSWLRVAKLTSTSNSAPAARTTCSPRSLACAAAASSSADLPTPGSPETSSAPPPASTRPRNPRRASSSSSRPTRPCPGPPGGRPAVSGPTPGSGRVAGEGPLPLRLPMCHQPSRRTRDGPGLRHAAPTFTNAPPYQRGVTPAPLKVWSAPLRSRRRILTHRWRIDCTESALAGCHHLDRGRHSCGSIATTTRPDCSDTPSTSSIQPWESCTEPERMSVSNCNGARRPDP